MTHRYKPRGVCSNEMVFEIRDGIIHDISIQGGCDGNLQAISRLVRGMRASEAAQKLRGIRCGLKTTSCPDQLATAIDQAIQKERNAG